MSGFPGTKCKPITPLITSIHLLSVAAHIKWLFSYKKKKIYTYIIWKQPFLVTGYCTMTILAVFFSLLSMCNIICDNVELDAEADTDIPDDFAF